MTVDALPVRAAATRTDAASKFVANGTLRRILAASASTGTLGYPREWKSPFVVVDPPALSAEPRSSKASSEHGESCTAGANSSSDEIDEGNPHAHRRRTSAAAGSSPRTRTDSHGCQPRSSRVLRLVCTHRPPTATPRHQQSSEPTSYTEGPNLGLTWCYFKAPWGQQLEVVSAPKGTVYDNEAKASGKMRLFNPALAKETLI